MVDINFNIPLLEKMWITLDERFIATWMNPKRILREGEAHLQLDRKRRLQEIELEGDKIHDERIQITHSEHGPLVRVEPHVDFERLSEVEKKQEYIRKQINLGKTILCAEDEITADDPVPEKEVDPDWLYRWKNQAEKFSSEDMQRLWGKVLAGEFKNPGSFNYRALDALSNLSKGDAEDFLLLCSLSFNYEDQIFIFDNEEKNKEYSLFHLKVLKLQEIGFLSYNSSSLTFDKEMILYSNKHKKIICLSGDSKKTFGVIFFTEVGRCLYDLIEVDLNLNYIRDNLSSLRDEGNIKSLLALEANLSSDRSQFIFNKNKIEEFK